MTTNRTHSFLFAAVLLACASFAHAQVSPFQGLGNAQFLDNTGAPLTAGVLYSYQAGTSTQQATYTDATGLYQNPNPIPFGSGARVSIWLTSGAFYKFVLCLQNDGSFCASADVLFSVDQVPGGSSAGGGGGGGGSPFISGSSTPATTGILRLASGDTVCYRNTANSANLCWRKDTNDLLSWDGGSLKFPEVGTPACTVGFDVLWADSSAHGWELCNNGGGPYSVAVNGADLSQNAVIQFHFGATATPLSGTPPTANQYLYWNGTNIAGAPGTPLVSNLPVVDLTGQGANVPATTALTPSANGYYFPMCYVVVTRAATASSTLPACQVSWTDGDTNLAETVVSLTATSLANSVGAYSTGNGPLFTMYVKAGTVIQYDTTAYASSGATSMQYAIHFRLIGPF